MGYRFFSPQAPQKYTKGMSTMTLLTADKKVGINFTELLALNNNKAIEIVEKAVDRQRTKYMKFHIPKIIPKNNGPVEPMSQLTTNGGSKGSVKLTK